MQGDELALAITRLHRGSSSAGRAAAFQAACRGFETHLPFHSGVAQLARAPGSYPGGHGFKSRPRNHLVQSGRQVHTRAMGTTPELGEELARFLGLDELGNRIITRLDRIERRLDRLNITPAELDALEVARASLKATDTTLDAIEPEGDTP